MPRIMPFLASVLLIGSWVAGANPAPTAAGVLATQATQNFGWARTWGGSTASTYATANRASLDGWGNLYVAGEFSGTVDFDPAPSTTDLHTSANGSIDAFLSKFAADGKFLWAKTWGGGSERDVAYGVGVDSSGDPYVVGAFRNTADFNPDPIGTATYTSNAGAENNIYLSKFAPDGSFQWVRTWGPSLVAGRTSFGAEAYTVVVAGTSLYVVGDFSGDQTDFNPWGGHDWHQNHLAGSGPIWFDAFLSKFDLNGNLQWARTWGGEGYDDGPGVAVDGAGNVYVAGMYASQTINFDPAGGNGGLGHPAQDSGMLVDVFLSKFDSGGTFQWVRTWGGQGTEDAMGLVVVDAQNDVYVGGRFMSRNCDFNPGGTPDLHSTNGDQDAFISKFAADGTFQWARTWGGSSTDNTMGLAVDGAGHVYASGWFSGTVDFDPGSGEAALASQGQKDVFLSQFDASGTFRWAKAWGGSGNDSGGMTIDGAGNVYAAGGFVTSVDFDPSSGVDIHSDTGKSGAFLSKFLVQSLTRSAYLPLAVR